MSNMGTSTTNTAPPHNIQVNGLKKLLLGQNPHKASGLDQISARFLKEMASSNAQTLTLINQASWEQGQIPDDLKKCLRDTFVQESNNGVFGSTITLLKSL